MSVSFLHGQPADLYGAKPFEVDSSFGRYGAGKCFLRGTPNVDEHGITRSETVVGRCRDVHVRFEGQVLLVEYVASENDFLVLVLFAFTHDVVEQFH